MRRSRARFLGRSPPVALRFSRAPARVAQVRVLVYDDGAPMRAGVRNRLAGFAEVLGVGRAGNTEDCVSLVRALHPDVVLFDVAVPVLDGLEALKVVREKCPGVACVVLLSGFDARRVGERALELGAAAWVDHVAPLREVVGALRAAAVDRARIG